MKLPPALVNSAERFNRMSLRERVLVFGALLAVLVVGGDSLLIQPMYAKEGALTAEIEQLNEQMNVAAGSIAQGPDATTLAEQKHAALTASLEAVNAELASATAGLIPPQRVAEMLREVLSRQGNVKLVSLHNEPVRSLVATSETDAAASLQGPYSHPVVMIVEGQYLDILDYLRTLEALSFRVYWNRLELSTDDYPRNRVRIELSTLSMDQDWLGV